MAHRSDAVALPAELLVNMLEYLPVDELWTAAQVSRQFYVTAWRAGLSIYRSIEWRAESGHADELAVFKDVVEQARRKDVLRISLTLTCFPPDLAQHADAAFQSGADEIFPVISTALPFLVHLAIETPDYFRPQLDTALRHPAPRLRIFDMDRISHHVPCDLPIPCDLFAGSASLLRTLKLRTVTLPDAAVPAFRFVSQAALSYENVFPHINFREQLPGLKDLDLEFTVSYNGHAALPDFLDLAQMPLRSLVTEAGSHKLNTTPLLDAVGRSTDLSAIPTVLTVGETIKYVEGLWPEDDAELSMRLSYSPQADEDQEYLLVTVSPEHRRWRRLHQINYWDAYHPVPLRALQGPVAQVTYLRLDDCVVAGVLEVALPFDALRQLHIDMHGHTAIQPPAYEDSRDLSSCPTGTRHPLLERLTLFAVHKPLKALDSRRIAFLAHELGSRPSLELVGVEFAEPVASALLEQTVSAVRMAAFAGRGSREDRDGGLWDVELFNGNLGGASGANC